MRFNACVLVREFTEDSLDMGLDTMPAPVQHTIYIFSRYTQTYIYTPGTQPGNTNTMCNTPQLMQDAGDVYHLFLVTVHLHYRYNQVQIYL